MSVPLLKKFCRVQSSIVVSSQNMPHSTQYFSRIALVSGVALIGLCAVLAACFFIPTRPPEQESKHSQTTATGTTPSDTVCIYVAEYLYHTGLILPVRSRVQDWSNEIDCLNASEYAEFGWGDSTYFMAGTVNAGMAVNALFASNASVMGVIGLDAPPFYTQPAQIQRLCLSVSDYAACVTYVRSCFLWEHSRTRRIKQGFWGNRSAFYAAHPASVGRYSLLNNCNVWSARCLQQSGVAMPLWAGIPQVLQWHVQRRNQ